MNSSELEPQLDSVGRRRYTTKSGSIYTIDFDKKTWERTRGKDAAIIRTDSGEFIDFSILYGYIHMVCPPINPPFLREITSTMITKVEDLDDDELRIDGQPSDEPD